MNWFEKLFIPNTLLKEVDEINRISNVKRYNAIQDCYRHIERIETQIKSLDITEDDVSYPYYKQFYSEFILINKLFIMY